MSSDKTEKATPRRRSKAREEGQVLKSIDLTSGIMLGVAFAVIIFYGTSLTEGLKGILIYNLSKLDITELTESGFIPFLIEYTIKVGFMLLPLLVALVVVAVFINMSQVGPLFTTKPIVPNPNKINPISGFKRIFSLKGLVELIKGVMKMAIIAFICVNTVSGSRDNLISLSDTDINTSISTIYALLFDISWKVCLFLILLGILDFIYQKYEYEKSIKMTKQEIKDEYKNIEGNPEIKRKIKSIQVQMAQSRMMGKVKTADVVVTNPTHFAVALKYDTKVAPAPYVVAKGVDLIAKKIKEKAKENNIPIVENKPLARSLHKLVDLNQMVPEELFVAVAEVLAYVYKKKSKKKRPKK